MERFFDRRTDGRIRVRDLDKALAIIREMRKAGARQRDIAERIGVTPARVSQLMREFGIGQD